MKAFRQNIICIAKICVLLITIMVLSVVNSPTVRAESVDEQASSAGTLLAAIANAPADGALYTIEITQEIALTNTLIIAFEKNIRLISDSISPVSIISNTERHFEVLGTLTLGHILLDGRDSGGGVLVNQGTLILNDGAVIMQCVAEHDGGGVYVDGGSLDIRGGSIAGNAAGLNGAGLYATNTSTITLSDGRIRENRLTGDYGQGGAGVNIADANSSFNMSGGEISDNETHYEGNAASTSGGGVVVNGTFHLTKGTISGNRSTNSGGGVMVASSGNFQMQGGVITGNTTATNASYVASGGGVAVHAGGVFTMDAGRIEENTGDYGGGVYVGHNLNDTVFHFNGGTIRANTAQYGGGILGQYEKSVINIAGGIVGGENAEDANKAEIGGGLFLHRATANIESGGIIGNNGTQSSGGIYVAHGKLNLSGGAVTANAAPYAGGISLTGDDTGPAVLQITAGEVSGNKAINTNGGGIYLTEYVDAHISGAVIKGNQAATNGGGLYLADGSDLTVDDTEITDNTAQDGGGAYVRSAAQLDGGPGLSITDNHAGNEGGGIYSGKFTAYTGTMDPANDYSNLTLQNNTVFSGNTANALYEPPDNAASFSNLGFTGVSASDLVSHPLNNYDINFVLAPPVTFHTIVYHANDGKVDPKTVTYMTEPGGSHVVKANTDPEIAIYRDGYTFTGWNGAPRGTGTDYPISSTLSNIQEDITLYAQWDTDTNLNRDDHFAYIIGYPDKTIRPYNGLTRAEATTMFFRLLTEDTRNAYLSDTNDFPDVQQGDWYHIAVSTMANAKIVLGYEDGTFRGDKPITRAEFATLAARFDSETYDGSDKFSDIGNHWAKEYINRAAEKGWIKGYDDGTFQPNRSITRAEAATLINRVLERDKVQQLHPDMLTWSDNVSGQWYYQDFQEATNSHLFERDDNGYETWTEVLTPPDWKTIETS